MENQKPATIEDVITLVTEGFKNVNTRFDKVETDVAELKGRVIGVEQQVASLQKQGVDVINRLEVVEESVSGIATHMDKRFDQFMPVVASKDFVERKVEGQSTKTHVLVNILKEKSVLTSQEATDVIRA